MTKDIVTEIGIAVHQVRTGCQPPCGHTFYPECPDEKITKAVLQVLHDHKVDIYITK